MHKRRRLFAGLGVVGSVLLTAMLIAGMMITAFGLLMAGFAIGFATSEPLDLNAEAAS